MKKIVTEKYQTNQDIFLLKISNQMKPNWFTFIIISWLKNIGIIILFIFSIIISVKAQFDYEKKHRKIK